MIQIYYDLTHSSSIGGEHATSVNGNGRNPGLKEILEIAKKLSLPLHEAEEIAEMIRDIVCSDLKKYLQ